MKARWYKAVDGDGLEIQQDGGEWCLYGIVRKERTCYNAILDRQEESFSLGVFGDREQAMDYLLARSGATLVSNEEEEPKP